VQEEVIQVLDILNPLHRFLVQLLQLEEDHTDNRVALEEEETAEEAVKVLVTAEVFRHPKVHQGGLQQVDVLQELEEAEELALQETMEHQDLHLQQDQVEMVKE
jgi:hypothetical protein